MAALASHAAALPADAASISGTVFEDVNYGGGAARDRATASGVVRPGARVELYNASGLYVTFTATDASGRFSFPGLIAGNYTVRVVNNSVSSSRAGYVAATHLAVQTFRTDVSSGTTQPVIDHVGGQTPAMADAADGRSGAIMNTTSGVFIASITGTAQSISNVALTGVGATEVDFGYCFDVIVNTNNAGQGSLRQFITNANALPNAGLAQQGRPAGIDNAIFMLADGTARPGVNTGYPSMLTSGIATIAPASALPTITSPVNLDAQTQPGSGGAPIVELRGTGAGAGTNGLTITGGGSTIRGLTINRFNLNGIAISGSGSNTVAGNYIGTNAAGTSGSPNLKYGVYINGSPGNLIGGITAAERNIISGNTWVGIGITGLAAIGNRIQGNYVGLDVTGTIAVRNSNDGIDVAGGATNTIIGGTVTGAGNVISGHNVATMDGIWLSLSSGTVIQGNRIGTNAAGTAPLPNARAGVYLINASNNTIGGADPGAGNLIAYNDSAGVLVSSNSTGNAILGNSSFGNRALGIDLGSNGVTTNDGTKSASLANRGMDFPVFTGAVLLGSTLDVSGYVGSAPGQSVFAGARVEVFEADNDLSGFGEGHTWLGSLTSDARGNFTGRFAVTDFNADDRITGTATDGSNNTSEFGADFLVGTTAAADLAVGALVDRSTPNEWDAVNFTWTVSNRGPSDAMNALLFDRLPRGLRLDSSSASQGSYTPASGAWVIGTLAAGSEATLTLTTTVLPGTAGSTLGDTAAVTAGVEDPVLANNAAIASVAVQAWGARVRSGTYVGDGNNLQAITGVGFRPDFVMVKAVNSTEPAVVATSSMPAGDCKELGLANSFQAKQITSFDDDGFTLGKDGNVNGVTYAWVCSKSGPGAMAVGTYVGDAIAFHAITGLGLEPGYLIIMGERATQAVQKFASEAFNQSVPFGAIGETANAIKSLDADGFSLGNDIDVNALGDTYHYVAWNTRPNSVAVGSYLAPGTDNLAITGAGFEPTFVIVKSKAAYGAAHRTSALVGDVTLPFAAGSSFPDGIQQLTPDGWQAGAHNTVNLAGTDYYWAAFRDQQPPASADLKVSIGADDKAPLRGDTLTYTVTVSNQGLDPASNVSLTDSLPAALAYLAHATSQGSYDASTGAWTLGSLAVGASATLSLTARVSPTFPGGALTNTAAIALSDQLDPVNANNLDSVTVIVETTAVRLVTGRYVGDGTAARAITGLEFQPDLVILRSSKPGATVATTSTLIASGAKSLGVAAAPRAGWILSLNPDGFSVGADTTVNAPGSEYSWVAFRAASGKLVVGSYVGDGTAVHSISGIGFQPAYGMILGSASTQAFQRFETQGAGKSVAFSASAEATNRILGFQADGFLVGSGAEVNQSGVSYHYAVWKSAAAEVSMTTYTGNGIDNRAISAGSFQPQFLMVKSQSATAGVHRSASLSSDLTLSFPPDASFEDGVQKFLPGGFQAGTSATVNSNGVIYHAIAFRDSATPISADLYVSHAADLANPMESSTVHFTVSVGNHGPDMATGVGITSLLPAGFTYRASAPSQGTYAPGSGAWTVGNLGSGDLATLILTATVNPGTVGSTLSNAAVVTAADQADLNPGNESASAEVTVRASASLVVSGDTSSVQVRAPVANQVAWTHTVSPGSNRLLVVGVSFRRAATETILGLSYGSQPLTRVGSAISTDLNTKFRSEVWGLIAPPVGTFPVTGTFSGNDAIVSVVGGAVSLYNVDLVAPFGAFADSGGTAGVPQVTVVSQPEDLVFSVLAMKGDNLNSVIPVTGLTEVWNRQTGNNDVSHTIGAASRSEGGPTVDVRWQPASPEQWALAAVPIQPVIGSCDLELSVAANPVTVNQGDSVLYTVSLANHGPDPATHVAISDAIPDGLGYLSSAASQGSYSSSTGQWTVGSLGVGSDATLQLWARVDQGVGGVLIPHGVTLFSVSQNDPVTNNNRDSVTIRVRSADLAVGISAGDTTAVAGDTLVYTVSLANAGPDTATAISVVDRIPAGLSYLSHVPSQGTYDSATGVWTAGSLPNGASATLQLRATVNAATGGTVITDTARVVTADQADPATGNNAATFAVTVQSADLEVNVSASPAQPTVGDTAQFTVTVHNHGPSAASGIAIIDRLPTALTYLSSSASHGSYASGSGTWTVGGIANGVTATLVLMARVDTAAAGLALMDTAFVASAGTTDPSANNNSDVATIRVQSSDLALAITVSNSTPDELSTITYTVTLTNSGPDSSATIVVTDVLPSGLTLEQAIVSGGGGSYDSGSGAWSLGGQPAGSLHTLRLIATVDYGTAGSTIVNRAAITAPGVFDPDVDNDRDSLNIHPAPAGSSGRSDLDLFSSVDSTTPDEGDTLTFTISVSNLGPDVASGIDVAAALPAGTSYLSDSADQGSYASGSGVWTVGSLLPAEVANLLLRATVDAGTASSVLTLASEVTALVQSDSVSANNSSTISVTVTSADLRVALIVDNNLPNEGDSLHYTMVVSNDGFSSATGVTVGHQLPIGLQYVSAVPSQGSYVPATGVWTLGTLSTGATATLALTATVEAGTGGSTLADTLSVMTADQADPISANNTFVTPIRVQSADLAVSVSATPPVVDQGDAVVYTVTLSNNGPDQASNVVVHDRLPVGLNYQSDTPSQGSYDRVTGRWIVGTLGSSGLATLTLAAVVDHGAGGVFLTNSASVLEADQADPDTDNNVDSTTIRIESADLAVSLAVSNSVAQVGDTLSYRVTLRNHGPDAASGLSVIERLPAGLSYQSHGADVGTYATSNGTWKIASLASGDSATLDLIATVDPDAAGSVLADTARIGAVDQDDPTPVNNVAVVTTRITSADLAVMLGVDTPSVRPGQSLTFTIIVMNLGPDSATMVHVTNPLPTALTFQSSQPTRGDYNAATGVWSLASLAVAARDTLRILAMVGSGAATPIVDTARVTARQADPQSANNAASVAVALVTNGVVTLRTVSQTSTTLAPAGGSGEVLRIPLINSGTGTITLDSLALTNRTSGPGTQAQLDAEWQPLSLSIIRGPITSAGSLTSSIAGNPAARFEDGKARFTNLSVPIASGDSVTVVIMGGASTSARDGDVLDLEVTGPGDLQFAESVDWVGTWPLAPPGSFGVDGMTGSQIVLQDAGERQIVSGARRSLAFSARLPANGYASDVLQKINIVNLGSARAVIDLVRVELWRDADASASFDAATDVLLGSMEFTGDRYEITGLAVAVPAEGLQVFVTVDVAETATEGRTVQLALPSLPDVAIGMSSNNDGPIDGVIAGPSVQTISTADRMTLTALPIAFGVTFPGARNVPLLHLRALNSYTSVRILSSLTVANLSSGSGSQTQRDNALSALELRADGDGDGQLDDLATDPLLGTTYFTSGRATFAGLNWSIASGTPVGLFITAHVAPGSAADPDVLRAAIQELNAVTFTENTAIAASLPIDSGARWTVDGMVAAQIANLGAPATTLGPASDPALAFDAIVPRNGYADDVLERIQLVTLGNAPATDLSEVRLWRDGGNGAFDAGSGDDRDLGAMAFAAGRWTSLPLTETLTAGGARVFATVRTAAIVTDSATVQFQLPRLGIQVQSGNDGPTDTTVTNPNALQLSNSALLATIALSPVASTVGQGVTAQVKVRNVSTSTITSITPSAPLLVGDGAITLLAGPSPATFDLAPGSEATFEWSLRADAAGAVHMRGSVSGTDVGNALVVQSILATSNPHRISLQAQALDIFSTGSMPFAINRGQTQVVPLSLTFANPGGDNTSDIRLRRLTVRLEDAVGGAVVPASVISRIVVNEGTTSYLEKTSLESSGSSIELIFAQPAQIQSGGGSSQQVTLSLSLDVLRTTVVPNFRVIIDGDASFAAEDVNSGAAVAMNLDSGQSYPLRSGLARVVTEATELLVSPVAHAPAKVGRGQHGVSLLDVSILNPGPAGVGSDVRLSTLGVQLIDSAGVVVPNPSSVLAHVKVQIGLQTSVDRDFTSMDGSTIRLVFASLLSLPVDTPTQLSITGAVSDSAAVGRFLMRLADSTTIDARDANTGLPVPVLHTAHPIDGTSLTIQARAESVMASRIQSLPASLPVGSKDVPAITLRVRHPGDASTSAIESRALTFRIRNQSGQPMVPAELLDRMTIVRDGVEVGRLTDFPGSAIGFTVPLTGVFVDPGTTTALDVQIDVSVTAPSVLFELVVSANGIAAFDRNLGTATVVVPDDNAELPLTSGLAQLQPPARQLIAAFTESMPAALVADGTALTVARLRLSNTAPATAGNIAIDHLRLIAADGDLNPIPIGAAVTRIEALVAGDLWAVTTTLADTATMATLAATSPLTLEGAQASEITLRITLRTGTTVKGLRIGCDAGGIGVVQPEDALLSVVVLAEAGQPFPFWTRPGHFSGLSLAESYSNFPNPFAAGRGETRFVFYMPLAGRVTLKIWTPRGELVATPAAGVPFASGLHQEVQWSGHNDRGQTVYNGAYVAELQVHFDDGATERLLRSIGVVR